MRLNRILTYVARLAMLATAVSWCGSAAAQAHPERRALRAGTKAYEQTEYETGEQHYRKAMEENRQSFEATFNLSDALYKQERYDEAVQLLQSLAADPSLSPDQLADVYHNMGNGLFAQQKLQEALECYKQSLRAQPDDLETKYNLAYVQKLLDDQQQQQQEQNQNQDQQQKNDQSQQQQQDKGKDNSNEQEQEQEHEQNQNRQNDNDRQQNDNGQSDQDEEQHENEPQQGQGNISREDADNILDALQQQEDKTREKVNARRAEGVSRSGKNW